MYVSKHNVMMLFEHCIQTAGVQGCIFFKNKEKKNLLDKFSKRDKQLIATYTSQLCERFKLHTQLKQPQK